MTVYRHASFPDWGRGVIVEEREGKIFMRFENAGDKALSSAPRFRSLLVPVPLPDEEALRIADALTKGARRPGSGRIFEMDSLWSRIMHELPRNNAVQNWSSNGFTGGMFRVVDVSASSVTVAGSGMSTERKISKAEFEKVFQLWDGYLAGRVSRDEMQEVSRNTTYIFSIFRRFTE